jgi:thimet oligopeptidase
MSFVKNWRRSAGRLLLCAGAAFAVAIAQAQEVPQTIKDALKRADDAVAKIIAIPDSQRTFENTVGALDEISVRLDDDTSLFIFMQNVSPDSAVRDQARAADEFVTNWAIALGKNEELYRAVKAYADTKPTLSGEQKRFLEFTLRDYRRSGMELPKEKRDRLKAVEMEMNKLGIEFGQNIADDETRVPLTLAELTGVPKDTLDRQTKSGNLILLKVDGPTYISVMEHCPNATTRQKVWLSYRRRAGTKNVRVLEKLIKLRAESASLLGYKNTVDYVIETRMAKNSKNVAKFYNDLIPLVNKKAALDKAEFEAAKRKHTKNPKATLDPWDYAYYRVLLLKDKYAVDSDKVSEYFPMESVVKGLFDLTSTLYNIEYKDVTADAGKLGLPVWHADVKLYEVYDKTSRELLGRLYTDLYPREGKYTHAACWGLQQRKVWADGSIQKPLAALVCNFTKPTATKPSLMPHDEVETFFHEFGHGLHQMLTKTSYGRFSGTAVERDFVEAPSQMMENWVWEPKVLNTFAKHYKTKQPLPVALLKGMQAARTLGSGIETQGQLYLGKMDQTFHTAADGAVDTTKTAQDVYQSTTIYKAVPGVMFQSSFGHLVGYEGAYYGYLWSLVYAQDMWQRFEELGVTSPKAGTYYRDKVLARGGTMDASDMLRDYLGREPKMDAFLKHLGLTSKAK